MEANTRRLNGLAIHYVVLDGPPPAVVFLHGVTDSLASYHLPMQMLAGTCRLLAMDLRGHGASGHREGGYRVHDHAADVLALVDEVVREPAVLAGHSLGGLVATAVAAGAGRARVRGLLLEDPPFFAARMPAFGETTEWQMFDGLRSLLRQHHASGGSLVALAEFVGALPVHPKLFEGRSLLEIAGPDAARARAEALHAMDPEALTPVLDGSQFDGFDPEVALARIEVPIHLLAGNPELGGAIAGHDAERLASLTPRYAHRTLHDAGHFIHHTAPAEYVDEVSALVAKMRAEGPRSA